MKWIPLVALVLVSFTSGCRKDESGGGNGKVPVLSSAQPLTLIHSTEHAGWMAFVDLSKYKIDAGTNFGIISKEFLEQVQKETAFGWGCPEQDFQVRIALKSPPEVLGTMPSAVGYLTTSGLVCLSSSDHLSLCAQYPRNKLPQMEDSRFSDRVFQVPPAYKVTVRQLFEYTAGSQFSEPLNAKFKPYEAYFEPAGNSETNAAAKIPWFK